MWNQHFLRPYKQPPFTIATISTTIIILHHEKTTFGNVTTYDERTAFICSTNRTAANASTDAGDAKDDPENE